jgi:hypothetical protein
LADGLDGSSILDDIGGNFDGNIGSGKEIDLKTLKIDP